MYSVEKLNSGEFRPRRVLKLRKAFHLKNFIYEIMIHILTKINYVERLEIKKALNTVNRNHFVYQLIY